MKVYRAVGKALRKLLKYAIKVCFPIGKRRRSRMCAETHFGRATGWLNAGKRFHQEAIFLLSRFPKSHTVGGRYIKKFKISSIWIMLTSTYIAIMGKNLSPPILRVQNFGLKLGSEAVPLRKLLFELLVYKYDIAAKPLVRAMQVSRVNRRFGEQYIERVL